ncbi:hypothetical protein PPROV_001002700 [Pycnococcus provasolii]|uniref:Uncharacterized protein n=1 Tax=Pycnococcus provasolii TaxID=41880 RepID=A0A830I2L9_9CHLO|nr:hypothetical protein PPROV_001002700 [Pycnococcus provasolii]
MASVSSTEPRAARAKRRRDAHETELSQLKVQQAARARTYIEDSVDIFFLCSNVEFRTEHLRAADKMHQATHYAPVVDPPLRIEQILAHKRLPSQDVLAALASVLAPRFYLQ